MAFVANASCPERNRHLHNTHEFKFENEQNKNAIEPTEPELDPLAQYLSTLETGPSVHRLTQMAACIEEFKDSMIYKDDPRFLKICLGYGASSESPGEMFRFMKAHEIGVTRASFFYHWANFLESTSQITEAKAAVKEGLDANAEPRALLAQLFEDLEQRYPSSVVPDTKGIKNPGASFGKLGVYVGDSDDDSSCEDEAQVPILATKKKLQHTRCTKSNERTSCTENSFQPITSYQYQLLRHRKFAEPMRPFSPDAVPLKVTRNSKKQPEFQPTGELKRAMYEQHLRITESIASARIGCAGDTEVL